MGALYFLFFVGLSAIALIWFVSKSVGKNRSNQESRGARPRRIYKPGHHPLLQSHAGRHRLDETREIWKPRRVRVLEEARGSYTFSANKINFDHDNELQEDSAAMEMSSIKYQTAPVPPKALSSK